MVEQEYDGITSVGGLVCECERSMTLPQPNSLGQYQLASGEWILPSPSFKEKYWIMRPNGKPVEYGLYHDSPEEALKFVNQMHSPK